MFFRRLQKNDNSEKRTKVYNFEWEYKRQNYKDQTKYIFNVENVREDKFEYDLLRIFNFFFPLL